MKMNNVVEKYSENLILCLKNINQDIRNESAEEKQQYLRSACNRCVEQIEDELSYEIRKNLPEYEEEVKVKNRIEDCFDDLKSRFNQLINKDFEKRYDEYELHWTVASNMENLYHRLATTQKQEETQAVNEQEKEWMQEEFVQAYREEVSHLQDKLKDQRKSHDKEVSASTENMIDDMVRNELKSEIHRILDSYELEKVGDISEIVNQILSKNLGENCLEDLKDIESSANQKITIEEDKIFEQIEQECLQVLNQELEKEQENTKEKEENNEFEESLKDLVNEPGKETMENEEQDYDTQEKDLTNNIMI